ncbi:MAG: S-formylglutathione hydrolase [Chitinophagales bacterium]|jgi:S-formylglutathione hydrolase
MSLKKISENKMFGGSYQRHSHYSAANQCAMTFGIFLPQAAKQNNVPVLYWLSGLTCTDENFMQKAGAQRVADALGIAIVTPDTSPRGDGVSDDAGGAYDLGLGAGFYVDATQAPWAKHYQMYSYVSEELPALIEAEFPVSNRKSISGHSMGGHGAISIGLKNPAHYQSISAFSPITNPINCAWGQKALTAYLGDNKDTWLAYDSCELIKSYASENQLPLLVDQGEADEFFPDQLLTQNLIDVTKDNNYPANIRLQAGFDHSYFFIASFVEHHLRFHAEHLLAE